MEENEKEDLINIEDEQNINNEPKEKRITLAQVIQKVKKIKLGVSDSDILDYINEFEADVQMEVLNKEPNELITYSLQDDQMTELIIPFPFYDVYSVYCETMICYEQKEYTAYNNSLQMFDALYLKYKRYMLNKDYESVGMCNYK